MSLIGLGGTPKMAIPCNERKEIYYCSFIHYVLVGLGTLHVKGFEIVIQVFCTSVSLGKDCFANVISLVILTQDFHTFDFCNPIPVEMSL